MYPPSRGMISTLPSLMDWIAAFKADVREVSDREDIHDAPGLIQGVTNQFVTD